MVSFVIQMFSQWPEGGFSTYYKLQKVCESMFWSLTIFTRSVIKTDKNAIGLWNEKFCIRICRTTTTSLFFVCRSWIACPENSWKASRDGARQVHETYLLKTKTLNYYKALQIIAT